uniref:Uncharacterized protein n=1 Tax=Theropithecus gelada TaxID=9565 RepID=A0A8D2EN53_THEGE
MKRKTKTPSEGAWASLNRERACSCQRLPARKAFPILVFITETTTACTDHFSS